MRPTVTPEKKQHSLTLSYCYRHNSVSTFQQEQQQEQQPSQVVPSAIAAATAATATVKLRSYLYQKGFSSIYSSNIIPFDRPIHNSTLRTITRRHRQRLRRRRKRSISSSSGSGDRSTCCSQLSYYGKLYIHRSLLRIRRRRNSRSKSRIRSKRSSTHSSASTSASHSTSVTPARGRSPAPKALTASNIIPAMTVYEKGDFITLRGANPQTGYVSPSIISLQNARFHTRFGSNSRSRSRSRSRSNPHLDISQAESRRKTPTSPGEALQLSSSGDDGHVTQSPNPYPDDAFAVTGERNLKVARNTHRVRLEQIARTFPSEGTAATDGSSSALERSHNTNTYSADSPTFDPFIAPMPSAENPQPYNTFVAMPVVLPLVDKNSRLSENQVTQPVISPKNKPRPITAHKSQRQRRPLSPHGEVVELSCAPPSSSSSSQPFSTLTPGNASNLGSVRRKPVGSSFCSYPSKILSSAPFTEASKAKMAPKQASTGKEGPKKFLEKLKSANKQGIGIKISSKPKDHPIMQLHGQEPRVLLIDEFNREKLYKTGWRLAKALSVIYLLWLTIRILFALRQILDVALIPLRIIVLIVAWFFRR